MFRLKRILFFSFFVFCLSYSVFAQFIFTPKTWDELTTASDLIVVGKVTSYDVIYSKQKFLKMQKNNGLGDPSLGLKFELEINQWIKSDTSGKRSKLLSILSPPINLEEGPFFEPGKTYLVFLKKADASENYGISYKDAILVKDRTDITGSPKNIFDASGSYVTAYRRAGAISNDNKINEFLQLSGNAKLPK